MNHNPAVSDFNSCIKFLKTRVQNPLPGFEGQRKMAPAFRASYDLRKLKNYRQGAVMILLFPADGKTQIVFIERSDDGHVHSGQIAFPGGKKDESDISLKETALRETFEETGVGHEQISVLGELTPLYIPPSNFLVTPFVSICNHIPAFEKNDFEVKK